MKKRTLILVALVAVLGGAAYAYFRGGAAPDAEQSTRTTNVAAVAASATSTDSLVAEITATIYQIDRLQLDPSIFNSAAFHFLQDRTQVIPPQEPGRDNPFAPIDASRAPVGTSSAASRALRAPTVTQGSGLLGGGAARQVAPATQPTPAR